MAYIYPNNAANDLFLTISNEKGNSQSTSIRMENSTSYSSKILKNALMNLTLVLLMQPNRRYCLGVTVCILSVTILSFSLGNQQKFVH